VIPLSCLFESRTGTHRPAFFSTFAAVNNTSVFMKDWFKLLFKHHSAAMLLIVAYTGTRAVKTAESELI
jgi:hypothetical protein